MKKSTLVKILEDNSELENYIKSLEDDINNTENIDESLDLIIDNILNMFNNFTDRRSLKATNIEALGTLLKLKAELPFKRIQSKKMILDILTKKNELEIKKSNAVVNRKLANNSSEMLKAIFMQLDQNKIHPIIEDAEIIYSECSDIIDKPLSLGLNDEKNGEINIRDKVNEDATIKINSIASLKDGNNG